MKKKTASGCRRGVRGDFPQKLVGRPRRLGEEIGRRRILRYSGGLDRRAIRTGEMRQRRAESLQVVRARQHVSIIGGESRARGHRLQRAVCYAAKLDRSLGKFIRKFSEKLRRLIEERMQRNELRSLHIPMRLFGLEAEIDGIGELLVEQRYHPLLHLGGQCVA